MRSKHLFSTLRATLALCVGTFVTLLIAIHAHAQFTASATFSDYKIGSRTAIITVLSDADVASAQVSTQGELSCSTYPRIAFTVTRGDQIYDLGDTGVIQAGSQWSASISPFRLHKKDELTAEITQAGIGCTKDKLLSASLTYMPTPAASPSPPSNASNTTTIVSSANGDSTNGNSLNSYAAVSQTNLAASLAMVVPTSPSAPPQPERAHMASTGAASGAVYADQYEGDDAGAKVNAAIASACAQKYSIVDATGFTGDQSSAATIRITCGLHLLLPKGVWTLSGNPGLENQSYEPSVIEGQNWEYNYAPANDNRGTVLRSGSAALLLVDASSQGTQWKNLELDGNSLGMLGYFGAGNMNAPTFSNINVHHFLYSGMMSIGFANYFTGHVMSSYNGGDGIVTAIDTKIEGEQQTWRNGGSAYHFLGGGGRIINAVTGNSGQHGIYVDARIPDDWKPNTLFVTPTVIKPSHNNPGEYYFYSLNPRATSGASNPTFCQYAGCVVGEEQAKWINIGTVVGPFLGNIEHLNLIGPDSELNGTSSSEAYKFDNIRFEGNADGSRTCALSSITNVFVNQVTGNPDVNGLHLLNCYGLQVSSYVYIGPSSYTGPLTSDYALLLENTSDITVDGVFSQWAGRSMIKEINTLNVAVSNADSYGTGQATTSSPDNFAVQIDADSQNATFNNLFVNQFPGDTNQCGVYNRGYGTVFSNYRRVPTALVDSYR